MRKHVCSIKSVLMGHCRQFNIFHHVLTVDKKKVIISAVQYLRKLITAPASGEI